jgi:hypothetical protein
MGTSPDSGGSGDVGSPDNTDDPKETLEGAIPQVSRASDGLRLDEGLSAEKPPVEASESVEPDVVVPVKLIEVPPVIAVTDLDWFAIRAASNPAAIRARMRMLVEQMEALLDSETSQNMLFDSDRAFANDRAIQVVGSQRNDHSLWIIGDLHGDLLTLETALAQIHRHAVTSNCSEAHLPRIVFLGDFFDDQGFGLEVLLRVFELIVTMPGRVCVVAGNHDEALSYDGARFASTVSPGDFVDFLNANLAHEWIGRAGKLAIRMIARAPRALFLPDGLLIAHGGFPLADLHPGLERTGNWNDPACLSDFVWVRAHPKARRKMPNRFSRGSQFGYEDFADFCSLSTRLGRPVTHLVRGHDHVEARYAVYPAFQAHPVLTTVALSRRLPREQFGSFERAPTIALVIEQSLPQVFQLHIPFDMINDAFPPPEEGHGHQEGVDQP